MAALGLTLPAGALAAGEPVMGLDEVQPGMACSVRSVLHGTAIARFDARVVDVVSGSVTGEGPRILVRVSGPAVDATGVGPGFSGSPVSCPDARGQQRIAGAISEGIGEATNHLVLATPIQAILNEPVSAPAHLTTARLPRARPLAGAWSISGAPAWLERAIETGAQHAGRTVLAAPAAPARAFAPVDLQPGAAMAASLATGDLDLGAVGTVTYRDGPRIWGFGHPLDGAGARSLPLQDAYVYDVVSLPGFAGGSYKLAAPGHVLGTLRNDTAQAVVGELGRAPRTIPLAVVARDGDRNTTTAVHVAVADESRLDDPSGGSPLRLMTAVSTAQAAGTALDGAPARQTATVCLRISLVGARAPLGFCTRELAEGDMPATLAGDVDQALALLDANSFARLRVRAVTVHITLRRGLQQAYLVSARGPHRARAGDRIIVRATVRRFRGPTSTLSFPVRIPRAAKPGPATITLSGPGQADAGDGGDLEATFAALLGDTGEDEPAGSMRELARRVAAIGHYDGLGARVRPAGGRITRVYRSADLRITGSAGLRLRIAARS